MNIKNIYFPDYNLKTKKYFWMNRPMNILCSRNVIIIRYNLTRDNIKTRSKKIQKKKKHNIGMKVPHFALYGHGVIHFTV